MLTAIVSIALGIVLFLCLYLGFRTGIRLGMNSAKGIVPVPLKSPAQTVRSVVSDIRTAMADNEAEKVKIKADSQQQQGLYNILNYSGDLPDEE